MKKHPGILKMIAYFEDYHEWDQTIDRHCRQFKKNFSVYPNIMIACRETWSALDAAANELGSENIFLSNLFEDDNFEEFNEDTTGLEDEAVEEGFAIKPLSGFATKKYSVEFCLDESVASKCFVLIFDEQPTFDGEDTESQGGYIRIA